jgi:hypothetical protein
MRDLLWLVAGYTRMNNKEEVIYRYHSFILCCAESHTLKKLYYGLNSTCGMLVETDETATCSFSPL